MGNNAYLVKFNKPYCFEGEECKEVDLSNLENLTAQDLVEASRIYSSQTGMPSISEADIFYTLIIAAKVTNKPLNFYEKLPAKESMKIKRIVSDFLFIEG